MKITAESLQNWMLVTLIFRMYMWQLESERELLTGMIQEKLKEFKNAVH
jgi:hypothetical protein